MFFWSFFHAPQTFSLRLQLAEYVQVVSRNTNGTCLKSASKTPTFKDFQHLKRLLHTSSQMANFGQFLANVGKTGFFKTALGPFFSLLEALINCKVSEKSNEGIPIKMRKTSIFWHFGPKWPIFDSFWPKWAKLTAKFQKKK